LSLGIGSLVRELDRQVRRVALSLNRKAGKSTRQLEERRTGAA